MPRILSVLVCAEGLLKAGTEHAGRQEPASEAKVNTKLCHLSSEAHLEAHSKEVISIHMEGALRDFVRDPPLPACLARECARAVPLLVLCRGESGGERVARARRLLLHEEPVGAVEA